MFQSKVTSCHETGELLIKKSNLNKYSVYVNNQINNKIFFYKKWFIYLDINVICSNKKILIIYPCMSTICKR